ncbi:DUF3237 domain-containing protein [Pseudonocardia halophobica]|uniref:DUF3237 domain-containing protein n=1 Tax=Pseudonocardia halophobica TaxID=29401 RepID=UPI003D91F562
MTIELVPLCTLRIELKPPIEVGCGAAGTRLVGELASAKIEGERLSAEMVGSAAADWIVVGPEGTAMVDVRSTYRTDDGVVIFVHYNGRVDVTNGLDPPLTLYVAPRFETGDERYTWLNRVQAVGKGVIREDFSLDYEWYEVR